MQTNRRVNYDRRATLSTDERDMLNLYKPASETYPLVDVDQAWEIIQLYLEKNNYPIDTMNKLHAAIAYNAFREFQERNK